MTQTPPPNQWPAHWGDPPDDDDQPFTPIRIRQPDEQPHQQDHRRGIFPTAPTPAENRDDALNFLTSYLLNNAADRGPFQIKKGENQPLPGVSVPTWLMTVLNILAGRPEFPYAHDRQQLHRDLVYLGSAAMVHVLTKWADDPDTRYAANIVRHEEQLRQGLFTEELLMSYVEDLAVATQLLELKIAAGRKEAVYQQLLTLMHHAEQTHDRSFWRPTMLRMLFNVPEITDAIHWLAEDDQYRYRDDVQAWLAIMDRLRDEPDVDLQRVSPLVDGESDPDEQDIRGATA